MKKDVHTEHCCVLHGCKYGDEDCPVVTKIKPQSYRCERCDDDGIEVDEVPIVVDETKPLPPNCRVALNPASTLKGCGKIVGISTIGMPVIGEVYMVRLDNPAASGIDVQTYPYRCVAVPRIHLTPVQS